MDVYSWVLLLDVYDWEGNCYFFFIDVYGGIYFIDGVIGEVFIKKKLDVVFEFFFVFWNNCIVFGVRGNWIFSFLVK